MCNDRKLIKINIKKRNRNSEQLCHLIFNETYLYLTLLVFLLAKIKAPKADFKT
jgi:hypothetical protein